MNVGDRVRAVKDLVFAKKGNKGTLKLAYSRGFDIRWDKNVGGWGNIQLGIVEGFGEFVNESNIELIENTQSTKQKYSVTVDGNTIRVKNKQTGNKGIATCLLDDTFDFGFGCKLAKAKADKDYKLVRELIDGTYEKVAKELVSIPKYKVGDKVKIRCDLGKYDRYSMYHDKESSNSVASDMVKFIGKIMTISQITDNKQYHLKESGFNWNWTDEMFE